MKRVIIATLMAGSILSAMDGASLQGGMNFNPMANTTESSKKDNYNDLIQFLSKSPSGEYSMSLGMIYLEGFTTPDALGNVVKPDLDKAIFYLKKSVDLGYTKSLFILGSVYYNDDRFKSIKNKNSLSEKYLSAAIDAGIYEAGVPLSSLYFYEYKNPKKAMQILHESADNNSSAAQLALAITYGFGAKDANIKKNEFLGNQFLELACKNKDKTTYVDKFCKSSYTLKQEEK